MRPIHKTRLPQATSHPCPPSWVMLRADVSAHPELGPLPGAEAGRKASKTGLGGVHTQIPTILALCMNFPMEGEALLTPVGSRPGQRASPDRDFERL